VAVTSNISLIIIITSLFISGVSCATELKDSEIVDRSRLNYKTALDDYEKQLGYCEAKSRKHKINKAVFKNINLTKLQFQTAIAHFYYAALEKCETEKFGVYLIHRGTYRETVKAFKANFNSDDPLYYDDLEVFGTRYYDIKYDLKYSKYPKIERDKLDKIPELKQLFNLLSVIGS